MCIGLNDVVGFLKIATLLRPFPEKDELARALRRAGWQVLVLRVVSNQERKGRWINVIARSSGDLPPGTLNSIFKQAGWKKGPN